MSNFRFPFTLFVFSVFFLVATTAYPQAISGDVSGTIADTSGAPIPDAPMTAHNVKTGMVATTQSNAVGQYRFVNLPVGSYTIESKLPGFALAAVENVLVELNKVSTVNIVLQVSGNSTSVEVTEAPQLLDTSTADVRSIYHSGSIDMMPMASSGLGVLNLSLLSSGVAGNGGVGAGVGPSVGGQRPRNNNFTVEGVDNNNKTTTGPQVLVPSDSVAEFTLLKNQFSPEYGHSSGGQFNTVLKTGGNDVHASIYEYLQNRHLNAVDVAFQRLGVTENPRRDQSQFGATLGGPIRHNRWFYFTSFEYSPSAEASTPGGNVLAPTAEGYSLLSATPGISARNLSLFKSYVPASEAATAAVNINGVSVPFGPLSIVAPNYQNAYAGVASTDYSISDRDQLRARFVYNRNTFIDTTGVSLPAFFLEDTATNYLATLAEFHTFSPNALNEFRLGYNRQNQMYGAGDFQFPGLDAFPNLTFDDIGLQLGPNPQSPQGGVQNLYQATDNFTLVRGVQTFTLGSEFRKYISPSVYTQRLRGDYEYSTVDLFLRDTTPDVAALRGLGNVRYYGDQIASYSYFQDAVRIRPNLTVNLGLRYEYTTVPFTARLQTLNASASVPGVLDFAEPKPQKTAFAPRVGVAYSPGKSGNTSIRAGFGMAYDIICDNLNVMALPPQLGSMADLTGAGESNFLASGGISPNIPGGSMQTPDEARGNTAFYIPIQTKLPYSVQWNLGVQRVFAKNYTFEVRYLGTRGVHLPMQQQINRVPRISAGFSIPEYANAPDAATLASLPLTVGDVRAVSNIVPRFASAGLLNPITAWTPEGKSLYNGLSFDLDRRFSKGLELRASYTWSHLLDNSTSEVGSTFLTPRRAQDFQDLRPEWATSMLDRRHRFTLMAVYTSSWLRHSNWFSRKILGNWEFGPSYVYESPEYFTVQSSIDSNLNGDSAADRAWINVNGAAHTASDVFGLDRQGNRISVSAPATEVNRVVAWVASDSNARYVRAGYGVQPTGGRNTEPTRPINNIDLTVQKRFPITERVHLEIAGQGFNLLNHPQFVPGLVDSADAVVTAYTPGVRNYVTAGHSAFGNAEAAFSSSPRVIQVVAKLVW